MPFPQPISDHIHDSSFVHSIMRAVETVDAMKRERRIPAGCGELVYPRLILEGRLERAAVRRLSSKNEISIVQGALYGAIPGVRKMLFPLLRSLFLMVPCSPHFIIRIWCGKNIVIGSP